MKTLASMIIAVVVGLAAVPAGTALAAPTLWPVNGNYYELILGSEGSLAPSWFDASTAAAASTFSGVNGHLATITSAEENSFVFGTGLLGIVSLRKRLTKN